MAKGSNRIDVLSAARLGGWVHMRELFDSGNVIVDTFTADLGRVRVVELRTPWTDSGRFAGAVLSDRRARTDRNMWSLRGRYGLIPMLREAQSA